MEIETGPRATFLRYLRKNLNDTGGSQPSKTKIHFLHFTNLSKRIHLNQIRKTKRCKWTVNNMQIISSISIQLSQSIHPSIPFSIPINCLFQFQLIYNPPYPRKASKKYWIFPPVFSFLLTNILEIILIQKKKGQKPFKCGKIWKWNKKAIEMIWQRQNTLNGPGPCFNFRF